MEQKLDKVRKLNPDAMPSWLADFWDRVDYDSVIAGINDDDCAVLSVGNSQIVISVDYLNSSPIALELGIGTLKDLGRILAAANLSDICGTGAKPIGFLSAIMMSKNTATENEFRELLSGIKDELSKHKVPLIGGDTKLGKENCFCGIAIGKKRKKGILFLKNGAKAGDFIWVSGNIGSVAASIDGLSNNLMEGQWNEWAKRKILVPKVPLKKSKALSRIEGINAGTDLSDGLIADLYSICEASNVGAIIYPEEIPLSDKVRDIAVVRKLAAWKYALTIGGDFQFIVSASSKTDLSTLGLKKIGCITKDTGVKLKFENSYHVLSKSGHSDFEIVDFRNEIYSLLSKLTFGNDQ